MIRTIALATVLAWIAAPASAGVVDFETVPGGAPVDGLAINNQFAPAGITFVMETGQSPLLAQLGGPASAFVSSFGNDTPAPGQGVGQFFLTAPHPLGPGTPPALILNFSSPNSYVAGEMIDVDLDESWIVQARNLAGKVIKSTRIAAGPDGQAVPFWLEAAAPTISSIRIAYTGTKPNKIGFALDNLSVSAVSGTHPVPEPTTGLLLVLAAALLRRRH